GLDMRRPEKLVDRRDRLDPVAALYEDGEVAGERDGIAGDRRDLLNIGTGDLLRLVLGAGARWIEDDPVEGIELLEGQRPTEQVALLDSDLPETRGEAGAAVQSRQGRRVRLDGMDFGPGREAQ